MAAIFQRDYRTAFLWMTLAVVIDATDGTLARRFRVRERLPNLDGRKLDDLVDYINYTFVPILLIYRAEWIPWPAEFWVAFPLIASLFGFAHLGAKAEEQGFFRGFPSYWNIVALYIAAWFHQYGPNVVLAILLFLSLLTVTPIRFVYPNRPPCWPLFFVGGGILWLPTVLAIIFLYPNVPSWLILLSALYPVLYCGISIYLDRKLRR